MSPWEVIGWIFVVLLAFFGLFAMTVLISGAVFGSWENVLKNRLRREQLARMHNETSVPWFRKLEAGDIFKVSHQAWRVEAIATDYDVEKSYHRLEIIARSVENQGD